MYVPGKLSDVERVLIDVGTGYYVEKVRGMLSGFGGGVDTAGYLPWGTAPRVCAAEPPLTPFAPFPQTADDARDFFKRKIDFLTKQMEKIQPALQEKHAMKQGKRPAPSPPLGGVPGTPRSPPPHSPGPLLSPQPWWK